MKLHMRLLTRLSTSAVLLLSQDITDSMEMELTELEEFLWTELDLIMMLMMGKVMVQGVDAVVPVHTTVT